MNPVVRILAVVAGAVVLGLTLLGTLGTALFAPLGMLAAWYVQRRRGRRLSTVAGWAAAVMTFAAAATIGFAVAVTIGPMKSLPAEMERAAEQARHQPPPQLPSIFRGLPQPPPGAVGAPSKAMLMISIVMGIEITGLLLGTFAWAGVWLLSYGIFGRPNPPLTSDPLASGQSSL